jgi:PIN domain nuclease of toxin-antitoxin system/antitoxin (DNA-binding transcriptional repressor) of toxin-antitoxin stability system
MELTAAEFKAKRLQLLDEVNRTGEVVTITKRGKVVAELRAPYGQKRTYAGPGSAIGNRQDRNSWRHRGANRHRVGSDEVIVLETHAFICYLFNHPQLPTVIRDQLAANPEDVLVPSICFWEATLLCERGSLSFGHESPDRTLKQQLQSVGFKKVPLTAEMAMLSRTLPFDHDDPADRFIVATAHALKAKLATSDRRLRSLPWVKMAY